LTRGDEFGILLTGLTPPHLCACVTPWPGFALYVVVYRVFSYLTGVYSFCWYW